MMKQWQIEAIKLKEQGYSGRAIARILGRSKSSVNSFFQGMQAATASPSPEIKGPKILFVDIETAPLRAAVWSLWQNNVGLNQIETDWFLLSYCYKFAHSDEVLYDDLRGVVGKEDDHKLLDALWKALDDADWVVAHNGRKFDCKKINARFILNGYPKPSPYKIVDTLEIAKAEFAFSSNKLQYLTDKLCETKKSTHGKFSGYELWAECLKDNIEAWEEMSAYNKLDVLSLEELYNILAPWSNKLPAIEVYTEDIDLSLWEKCDYVYTNFGKYDCYRNKVTGQYKRGRINLLSKEKRASLLANIS